MTDPILPLLASHPEVRPGTAPGLLAAHDAGVLAPGRAATLREAADLACRFTDRYEDFEAMRAAGIIGPHTVAGAIADELRRMADAEQAPAPQPETIRAAVATALESAHETQPCTCGSTIWSSCCHLGAVSWTERRTRAVMAALTPLLSAPQPETTPDPEQWDRIADALTRELGSDSAVQARRLAAVVVAVLTPEPAPYQSWPLPPRDAACASCGHAGAEHHHERTKCWAELPRGRRADGTWDPVLVCDCPKFTGKAPAPEPECVASISGTCLRESQGEGPCLTEDGECVYGGRPAPEPTADAAVIDRLCLGAADDRPESAERAAARMLGHADAAETDAYLDQQHHGAADAEGDAEQAAESTPDWQRRRTAALGEFVRCTASGCPNGEWSTKADGRGWVGGGEVWHCPEHAPDADDYPDAGAGTDDEDGDGQGGDR